MTRFKYLYIVIVVMGCVSAGVMEVCELLVDYVSNKHDGPLSHEQQRQMPPLAKRLVMMQNAGYFRDSAFYKFIALDKVYLHICL